MATADSFPSTATNDLARPGLRERRRQQTREEILDAALDVITEHGAAALNMSEVARRIGLRQPSLYQYFDSRLAIYDGLFERGMRHHLRIVMEAMSHNPLGLPALRAIAVGTGRFAAENPALAQLIFMPAIPGFEPSPHAYEPSLNVQHHVSAALTAAIDQGDLHPAAATDPGIAMFISATAGLAVMHLANDPHATADNSRYLSLIDPAVTMWATWFAPDRPTDRVP